MCLSDLQGLVLRLEDEVDFACVTRIFTLS